MAALGRRDEKTYTRGITDLYLDTSARKQELGTGDTRAELSSCLGTHDWACMAIL